MPKDRVCWVAAFNGWRQVRERRKEGGSGTATRTVALGGIVGATGDEREVEQRVVVHLALSHDGSCTFWIRISRSLVGGSTKQRFRHRYHAVPV